MTVRRWTLALVVVAVATALVVARPAPRGSASATPLSCAQALVTHWTLSRLAAETIVVPVDATQVSTMAPAASAGYGGLILFGATAPANLAAQLAAVQAHSVSGYPLLVMSDEEGGGVWRLANLVAAIPWAQTMGKTLSAAKITALATKVGRQLVHLGVTVDLAPVLDVDPRAVYPGASDPDGFRSFSGSPATAAADGVAFATGLAAAGMTAVVKHFPGLGGASANTDDGPAHTRSWSSLQTTGLVPFRAAIAAGVPAVMLSNATIPGFSAQPSGVSARVVRYLRTTLGFTGLIVTDSLSAGAMGADHLSVPIAAVAALRAGADEVLFDAPAAPATALSLSNQVRAGIVAAVVHGSLARSALVSAAAQVLAVRHNVCSTTTTT